MINGQFGNPDESAPAPTSPGVADWYKKEFPQPARKVLALDGAQADADRRLLRHEDAGGAVPAVRAGAHGAPPRPARRRICGRWAARCRASTAAASTSRGRAAAGRQRAKRACFPISARFSIGCAATTISSRSRRRSIANLEAAEIHRRVIAAGGPALLFTNVTGADFPLVTNLFGTARRAELAFGERPLRLIKRLVHLAETLLPPTPGEAVGRARRRPRAAARRHAPAARGPGPRRRHRPTSGSIACRSSRAGRRTAGRSSRCRSSTRRIPPGPATTSACTACTCTIARTTGMHWQIGKGGGFHYALAEARGEALPATVFLGGPPALILSAIAPLPENVPELMLASLIAGERLPQVAAPGGHPHPLIASAEFALMGEVPPRVRRPEGPVRRSLRLLLAAARLSRCSRCSADRAPARRDLSGDGRRQAAAGGLLHRRSAAGAAVAALPAGDAGGRAAVVVRRDRLSLARRPRSSSSATSARRWPAPSAFSAKGSCR